MATDVSLCYITRVFVFPPSSSSHKGHPWSDTMIDHILGKPSPLWRRTQVFLVILFWVFRLYIGDGRIRSNSRFARKLAAGMEKSRWWRWLRLRRGLLGIMGYINEKFGQLPAGELAACG